MAVDIARRSPPDTEPRAGFAWRVVADEGWRIPLEAKRCRRIEGNPRHGCGKPAVAEFNRINGWWAYCADHMYGRWIESEGPLAGLVVGWRLRPVES